jgi:cyclopropane-fatty-acyl-phospholipid synthase
LPTDNSELLATGSRLAADESPGQSPTVARRIVRTLFRRLLESDSVQIVSDDRSMPASADDPIYVRLPNLYWTARILMQPDTLLGQTYVDQRWLVQPEKLFSFLHLIRSQDRSGLQQWFLFSTRFHTIRDALKQRLFPIRSTRAVVEHYNTDPVFMSFILGSSLSYTCAFFDQDHRTLDEAQQNKLELIAARIQLRRGHSVLDLGVGWGYAAFPLAEGFECPVTGITLSQAQVDFCEERRAAQPHSELLTFVRADYADFVPAHPFDRVISIGMLEHVGKFQYRSFFNRIADFLVADGVALIHSMVEGQETSPDAWVDRNIFPGGYIPTMSEVLHGIETSKCELMQVHLHDKLNYFQTLECWKQNLFEHRGQCESRLAELRLTEADARKVIRIWEYFLSSSQIAFCEKFGRCQVAQFVVRKQR